MPRDAIVFACGAGVGCAVALLLRLGRRRHSSPQLLSSRTAAAPRSSSGERELPQRMIDEMLSRHEAFFGKEAHLKVRSARICVLGLGGVGSHVAMMLARAGVSYMRVVDFDRVSLSSLNRHAVARLSDVGLLKSETIAEAIKETAPFVTIDARPEMFSEATSDGLLSASPDAPFDIVVDCIDDVDTKATLLADCAKRNLRVLSAMGAGGKADPTRICVAGLADAVHDPLAQKLRWKLRGKDVDYTDLECVYSYEKPRCTLLPLTDAQVEEGASAFGTVDNFRVRVLPVLGASPALMGQAMASITLCRIAGTPISPTPREPLSRKIKEKMLGNLRRREARRELGDKALPEDCDWIDAIHDELEYVCCEVWRGRCAATRTKIERKPLSFARWYTSRRPFGRRNETKSNVGVQPDELILLTKELAHALDAALDDCADAAYPDQPTRDQLFQAAAKALRSVEKAKLVDARFFQMQQAAGGPWATAE